MGSSSIDPARVPYQALLQIDLLLYCQRNPLKIMAFTNRFHNFCTIFYVRDFKKKVRDITKILTHLTEIYKKQQALSLVVKKTFLHFAIVMQSVVYRIIQT